MNEKRIENPIWYNEEKTQIICNMINGSGRFTAVVTKSEDGSNPDWDMIVAKYTNQEIDDNTQKNKNNIERIKNQKFEEYKLQVDKSQKEALFNVKAEAFEIDLIKNSSNRELKNKLRRSKSILEAQILASILYKEELEKVK